MSRYTSSSSNDPYGKPPAAAAAASSYGNSYGAATTTTTSSSAAISADDYDPYAKYDNAPSSSNASSGYGSSNPSSGYGSSGGYTSNSYGNTTSAGNDTSHISADDYDPYAKYDNNSSSVPATSTATTSSSSYAPSSGYNSYGNTTSTGNDTSNVSADDYDPYAKYDNNPSAPSTGAASTTTTSSSSSYGASSGYGGYGSNAGNSAPDTSADDYDPYAQYDNAPSSTPAATPVATPSTQQDDGFSTGFHNGGGGTGPSSHHAHAPAQVGTVVGATPPLPQKEYVQVTMGSSNASPSQLAPIAPQHATLQPTELFLKEKTMSWTGDDAKIKDANGSVVFQIKADMLTFTQSRTLVDASGTTLGVLKHKLMDFAPTIYIGTPANEKKVKLKTTGMFNPLNCNASISVDGVEVGKVKGNWRAKKYSIKIGGVEIATVGRKTTMASLFMDADSYVISVRPQGQPVDLAFISLLAIGLDELYHDK